MNLNEYNQGMKVQIKYYQDTHYPTYTPEGSERYEGSENGWMAPYTNFQTGSNVYCMVVFGAQYKFWSFGTYNFGSYVLLRGAEMLLAEAEAAYHNGQPNVATANLEELNKERNPNYECNMSGEDLYEEIKLQRRLELWGEGHNFFDLKRWNMPMVRKPWIENDPESNNIPAQFQMEKNPSDPGWVYTVPEIEETKNKAFDRSLLNH